MGVFHLGLNSPHVAFNNDEWAFHSGLNSPHVVFNNDEWVLY